eukprot:2803068-Alexandrium_andersonii.AAC.1
METRSVQLYTCFRALPEPSGTLKHRRALLMQPLILEAGATHAPGDSADAFTRLAQTQYVQARDARGRRLHSESSGLRRLRRPG